MVSPDFMRYTGIVSIIIGISLAIIGRMILTSLRQEFNEFYKEHRRKLLIAFILLFLSNLITGLHLVNAKSIFGISKQKYSISRGLMKVNQIFIPMFVSLSALMFGFIRNTQVKEKRYLDESVINLSEFDRSCTQIFDSFDPPIYNRTSTNA